jgi:hypothetical protein
MLVTSVSSLLEVRGYGCLRNSQLFAHFHQRKVSFIWSEGKNQIVSGIMASVKMMDRLKTWWKKEATCST